MRLHPIAPGPGPGPVGDVWLMDELIGSRRLRMSAQVVELVPGERLVWRLRWWRVPLPAWLTLQLRPDGDGVLLRHVQTEFPLLRDLLRRQPG